MRTVSGILAEFFSFSDPSPLSLCFGNSCSVMLGRVLGDMTGGGGHFISDSISNDGIAACLSCIPLEFLVLNTQIAVEQME